MSFRVIKDWFFSGLSRRRSRHGQIVVTSEGECVIVVRFQPTMIQAFFTDREPPIDPCSPHEPDDVSCDLVYLSRGKWGVKIHWHVWTARRVKYVIEGVA